LDDHKQETVKDVEGNEYENLRNKTKTILTSLNQIHGAETLKSYQFLM